MGIEQFIIMGTVLLGVGLLIGGAELLVRGASRLALGLNVPVMVVALTVVAFGTSMPELIVSLVAALEGSSDIALGNVTGSNIANILLVLGAAALVAPIITDRDLMKRDLPVNFALQIGMMLMFLDGQLSRIDGAILLTGGILFNGYLVKEARAGRVKMDDDEDITPGGTALGNGLMLVGGLVILIFGGKLFVDGAVDLAKWIGLSERVVSLTIVALGTSAPEVVTAVISSLRGQADMAVGNSVGSNILNISMVLGVTAMLCPIVMGPSKTWIDLWLALGCVVIVAIPALFFKRIGRTAGASLCLLYFGYVAYLLMG